MDEERQLTGPWWALRQARHELHRLRDQALPSVILIVDDALSIQPTIGRNAAELGPSYSDYESLHTLHKLNQEAQGIYQRAALGYREVAAQALREWSADIMSEYEGTSALSSKLAQIDKLKQALMEV